MSRYHESIDNVLKKVGALRLELPQAVADDALPDIHRTIVSLREELDHTPHWRDRPSGPGWWAYRLNPPYGRWVVTYLSQQKIDDGIPFGAKRVYGPIPDDPEETKP